MFAIFDLAAFRYLHQIAAPGRSQVWGDRADCLTFDTPGHAQDTIRSVFYGDTRFMVVCLTPGSPAV